VSLPCKILHNGVHKNLSDDIYNVELNVENEWKRRQKQHNILLLQLGTPLRSHLCSSYVNICITFLQRVSI